MKSNNKTKINKNGYLVFTDSGRLVHRWAMEKKLERKLKKKAYTRKDLGF